MNESVADLRPETLGERGSALWDALMDDRGQDVPRAVLAGEAARLADRLDKLDQLLSGNVDCWTRLRHREGNDDAVLIVDSAAGEARQATNTLRQLVAQLVGSTADQGSSGGSIADELARRRAGRDTGT
ncbi:hypothetical protein [Nocardia cyriacigeorgica]|uniref:hypothetical protein n=1 Tax=Nocardia cyriacigeorgica TaxID=135487 RepID=UPI0013D79560|nr:hypothetical protein [Nocardia cyriacigeorgica]NEW27256.1 hypothetical protein [Nocardia cyriacigeorgica]